MGFPKSAKTEAGNLNSDKTPNISAHLLELAQQEPDAVLKELESQPGGLSAEEPSSSEAVHKAIQLV